MSNNGTGKAQITCSHCGQVLIRCPNAKCAKYAIWIVKEVQLSWGLLAITDERAASIVESRIIAPPLGLAIN